MTITDSVSVAMNGLLYGQGLNLTGTATILSQLAAAPLITTALAAIAHVGSTANTLGNTTLPGVCGTVPSTITNIGSGNGITFYNTQANSLTNSGNMTSFLINFGQINGYCSLAASTTSQMTQSLNLTTQGIKNTRNTLAYSLTSGISVLLTSPTKENLTSLQNDLQALGSLYDLTDLTNLGLPGKIYIALYNAGIPGAVNAATSLTNQGVDLTNPTSSTFQTAFLKALLNINSANDINAILSYFNITLSTNAIQNAASFTNPQVAFLTSYALLSNNTFSTIGTALHGINLNNSIRYFTDLASILEAITYPANYDTICTTNTTVSATTIYSIASKLGAGTAPGGTLSITDFMGILNLSVLQSYVTTMITNLTNLSNTSAGANLQTLFTNLLGSTGVTAPGIITSINAALATLLTASYGSLASQYAIAANFAWVKIMSMLSVSIYAVSTSGLAMSAVSGTQPTSVLGFALALPTYGADTLGLGTGALLSSMATTDSVGSAIQVALSGG